MATCHAGADEGTTVTDVVLELLKWAYDLCPVSGELRLKDVRLVLDGRMDHERDGRFNFCHSKRMTRHALFWRGLLDVQRFEAITTTGSEDHC